ncbi:MAG: 50S ribosomal protein L17 [Actinomycetota bacterium]
MPKPKKGPRLGSGPTHQGHLLRGLAASLITEERIQTSEARAKLLRPFAEKLVTLGKANTIHSRRQALTVVEDSDVVHKLFAEIAPRYSERSGGYTRILKLGPRKGDAAPMAIIEFVEAQAEAAPSDDAATKKRGLRRRKAAESSTKAARTKAKEAEPAASSRAEPDDGPAAGPVKVPVKVPVEVPVKAKAKAKAKSAPAEVEAESAPPEQAKAAVDPLEESEPAESPNQSIDED